MRNIMIKEMKLSASLLSYLFIFFAFIFFLPGYPVLCGVFFVTLGIFQSYQNMGQTNDILFSALLPVAKRDVVKGKFIFACIIELCSLLLISLAVLLRMTVLSDAAVYRSNALMNANFFALGMAFFIFGLFNTVFIGKFFKTAYKFGRPFVIYTIAAFLTIGVAESLHYFPCLEVLNAFSTEHMTLQASLLIIGITAYILMTYLSFVISCRRFEKIDL